MYYKKHNRNNSKKPKFLLRWLNIIAKHKNNKLSRRARKGSKIIMSEGNVFKAKKNKKKSLLNFAELRKNLNHIYWLIIIFCFLGIIYILFFSAYFNIKEFIISENINDYDRNKILNIVKTRLKEHQYYENIFLFPTNKIIQDIKDFYNFKDIKLLKDYLNNIVYINIKERNTSALAVINNKYYYFDFDGNIEKEIQYKNINTNLPIVYILGINNIKIGENILPKYIVGNLKNIIDKIENNTPLKIIAVKIQPLSLVDNKMKLEDKNKLKELILLTEQGIPIYLGSKIFRVNDQLNIQIEQLITAFEEKIKDVQLKNIEYIDNRFADRVYIKYKNNK